MIKKFFKFIFKSILFIVLLIALIYGGFHLWEYSTGGKYVDYLTENAETIPLDESFTFDQIGEDIPKNKLILLGEIHGFQTPIDFDVHFFQYLYEVHGVRHYFAEFDYVQGILLNRYLETGDEELLRSILRKWVVVQGRNNKSYFAKYQQLHQFYNKLPDDQKFQFIGIDRLQDLTLAAHYLNEYDSIAIDTENVSSELLKEANEQLILLHGDSAAHSFTFEHIQRNLNLYQEKQNREEILFQNFNTIYQNLQLENTIVYGHFGLYHVFQYGVNGQQPLASKIRQSNLGLDGKILSVNCMMNESYMVMPSNQLPEFMTDGGKYTKMPISADNMLFMYLVGVKDFKRTTPEQHQSLIKMDAENSPYANTVRLNSVIQILPVADKFEMDETDKAYIQYTLFVRNSDWAEPFED